MLIKGYYKTLGRNYMELVRKELRLKFCKLWLGYPISYLLITLVNRSLRVKIELLEIRQNLIRNKLWFGSL